MSTSLGVGTFFPDSYIHQHMKSLQYSKEILEKVSFDRELLSKEYKKALKVLSKEEANSLKLWYKAKFESDDKKWLNNQKSDNS